MVSGRDRTARPRTRGITVKSAKELELMSRAGWVVAQAKARLREAVAPGVTTGELDRIAAEEIARLGATSSFKGYTGVGAPPFPGTICASVNEEIVHGIPGDRVLQEGDIVSLDVGAIVCGFHGDSAFTCAVGSVSEDRRRLIDATREALRLGIAEARAGARIGDISAAVESHAVQLGYSVVRQYVGHGIGRHMHEEPQVPNYGVAGRGPLLREGMTIAIEPMLNIGTWETAQLDDGWTVVTADGNVSAHFEDTIAITSNGARILTSLDDLSQRS